MPRPTDGLEGEEYDHARDKAELCSAASIQPSEYDQLTDLERDAFVEVLNRRNR
jgi:hypothetical protein